MLSCVPASLLALWQWLLPPCFESCCSLGSWHCFCVLSHVNGISHSLLSCCFQPSMAYVPYSCTSFSLAYMWKPLPRNTCINHAPEPLLWYHMYKNSAELCCLQTPEHYLGLPSFVVPISFLSNLPINLFYFVLSGCFGKYFLNLATSKYRESWSLVRIHSSSVTLSNNSFM